MIQHLRPIHLTAHKSQCSQSNTTKYNSPQSITPKRNSLPLSTVRWSKTALSKRNYAVKKSARALPFQIDDYCHRSTWSFSTGTTWGIYLLCKGLTCGTRNGVPRPPVYHVVVKSVSDYGARSCMHSYVRQFKSRHSKGLRRAPTHTPLTYIRHQNKSGRGWGRRGYVTPPNTNLVWLALHGCDISVTVVRNGWSVLCVLSLWKRDNCVTGWLRDSYRGVTVHVGYVVESPCVFPNMGEGCRMKIGKGR